MFRNGLVGSVRTEDRILQCRRTSSDIDHILSSASGELASQDEHVDVAVMKPWGSEYLLYSGISSALWVLSLREGQMTSMHCHQYKSTCLVVARGAVMCATLGGSVRRNVGDVLCIDAGVFHQTGAPEGDAVVIELETPPAKNDLLRLHDIYGRAGSCYEGSAAYKPLPEHTTICRADCEELVVCRSLDHARMEFFRPASASGRQRIEGLDGRELVLLLEGADITMPSGWLAGVGFCCRASEVQSGVRWSSDSLVALISLPTEA